VVGDEWWLEAGEIEDERASYEAVRRFEDLVAWQRAREMTSAIYDVCRTSALKQDFGLRDQLQRASVSVMSNIAEGNERGTSQEYFRYLTIAKASCAEVRSLLYVALDAGHIDHTTFDDRMRQAEEVARLVGGLRSSIARRIARDNGY
jgi:four helix bundle protein